MAVHPACGVLGSRVVPNYLRAKRHRVPLECVLHSGLAVDFIFSVILTVVAVALAGYTVKSVGETLAI